MTVVLSAISIDLLHFLSSFVALKCPSEYYQKIRGLGPQSSFHNKEGKMMGVRTRYTTQGKCRIHTCAVERIFCFTHETICLCKTMKLSEASKVTSLYITICPGSFQLASDFSAPMKYRVFLSFLFYYYLFIYFFLVSVGLWARNGAGPMWVLHLFFGYRIRHLIPAQSIFFFKWMNKNGHFLFFYLLFLDSFILFI